MKKRIITAVVLASCFLMPFDSEAKKDELRKREKLLITKYEVSDAIGNSTFKGKGNYKKVQEAYQTWRRLNDNTYSLLTTNESEKENSTIVQMKNTLFQSMAKCEISDVRGKSTFYGKGNCKKVQAAYEAWKRQNM